MLPINLIAVLIAAVAAFIVGFLFHGPLFGKLWMRLANITPTGNEKFSDMVPQMLWNLLANVFSAYTLAVVYLFGTYSAYINESVWGGVCVGLIVWFGFTVTSTSMDTIWMGKKVKLWLFEVVSSAVVFMVMGAIIASF